MFCLNASRSMGRDAGLLMWLETIGSRIGPEKKEDEHAGDRDVEPDREGVARDLFVGLKLGTGRVVERGENQGQGDNGQHDVADQDEKIQQPNRSLSRKGRIAMKMVIDDITHQKEDREHERGQHAAYMPVPVAALDIDKPADQTAGAQGIEAGVGRREVGHPLSLRCGRGLIVNQPD